MTGEKKRERKFYIVCFVVIWAVQMAAAFYFCTCKQGFHEDEYYTYYSTARTNGFYIEDGVWMTREAYRNEFVVLKGQQFQYGLVKQVQSWDVHPPVYYWVFHTIESLTPGVFSKWTGLMLNLFFHGINLVLLTYLSYLMCGRNRKAALGVTLFYGLTPAAVSGVVFIRMYEMLTMWVLICAILHVGAVKSREEAALAERVSAGDEDAGAAAVRKLSRQKFLIPLSVVTYLGFLTQYYYFIFLFFIGAAFCVYLLWRDRSVRNCLRYGISQMAAFALAYLTYPSCLGQMFRGQRGAQATENFMDLSNTLERLRFFYNLLDEYVFGEWLTELLLVMMAAAALWVYVEKRRRKKGDVRARTPAERGIAADTAFWVLAAAVTGYFLAVSKTALLLGDTSNRYQLPVYGMIVLLLFTASRRLGARLWDCILTGRSGAAGRKLAVSAAVILCLLVDLNGLAGGRVVFLYPEDEGQTAFAAECARADIPVVYLYQPGAEWCVWDVTNELLEYPAVYFAAADSGELIADERIAQAQQLVVYLADGADADVQLQRILDGCEYLTEYGQPVFEEKYCDVYYLQQ
ncbi:MAG: hypothetical protein J6A08_08615 [Lachnospiraceae bacterium]|nr:hypothetical protein [Lachnospiraceae bacterium]